MRVIRRRDAGARLEVAIAGLAVAQAAVQEPPGAPSVFATLRRDHPALEPRRLKKATLIALSWAIEDECCARAERPIIFGSFQEHRFFRASQERWTELARIAHSTTVFADFADAPESVGGHDPGAPPGPSPDAAGVGGRL